MTMPTPSRILSRLLAVEASSRRAPDCRRIASDERCRLQSAINGGDTDEIARVARGAWQFLDSWGLTV